MISTLQQNSKNRKLCSQLSAVAEIGVNQRSKDEMTQSLDQNNRL